jgi:hypothetical protein
MPAESQPPRPFQFSVRHLLAVVLGLSVVLALVTQLAHVGLIAAVFLAGLVLGAWRREWRLAAASGTALFTFAVSLAAAWLLMGNDETILLGRRGQMEYYWLRHLNDSIEEYAREHGDYPDALADVPDLIRPTDSWGNAYYYRKLDRGFELAALGADGKRGGTGPATDIEAPAGGQRRPAHIPALQFLFHAPISGRVVVIAALASVIAAAIWYAAQPPQFPRVAVALLSLLATAACAVVVAVFLALVHLALEHSSGH